MCWGVKHLSIAGLVVALFWSGLAHSFGAKAHRIVGHIAERQICTETRAALREISPDYDLSEDGVWADRIRGDSSWDKARPWHFLNVPDETPVAARRVNPAGDVLVALDRFTAELANPQLPVQQRRIAYYFVVHFVADIHQPLHVGRADDRGGNRVRVRTAAGAKTNLHSYWDTYVLEQNPIWPYLYAIWLTAWYSQQAPQWAGSGPLVWAEESQLLRPEVYDFELDSATGAALLDDNYQLKASEIIDLRIAQAGFRLAGYLDHIFCVSEPLDLP